MENVCVAQQCVAQPVESAACGGADADTVVPADVGDTAEVIDSQGLDGGPDIEPNDGEGDLDTTRDELVADALDGVDTEASAEEVIADTLEDDSRDGEVDESCPLGSPCEGLGECGAGEIECDALGRARCSTNPGGSASQAVAELCDDLDNDCDGLTDEDFGVDGEVMLEGALFGGDEGKVKGEHCGAGACVDGVVVCAEDQVSLVCSSDVDARPDDSCNDEDDDCNGVTDDVFVSGAASELRSLTGARSPSDDGKGKGEPCGVGACVAAGAGVVACAADGAALVCTSDALARTERCDHLDDDCDGLTDEGFDDQGIAIGDACDGIGVCGGGVVVCRADGSGATCSTNPGGGDSQAIVERCNGLDDDCDGMTDEGFTYAGVALGGPCDGVGECGVGSVECNAMGQATCSTNRDGSAAEDVAETCNDKDDDCDGMTDDACETVCSPMCAHGGECLVGNLCDCTGTGYGGSRCETPVCAPSCIHGSCVAPDTCDCAGTGYSGTRCETPVCTLSCLNGGTCTAPDTCDCVGTNYTGTRCQDPVCTPSCANGGACIAPNACDCTGTGYTGSTCQTPVCSPSCANDGICTAPDTCNCTGTGYTGNRCQTPVCSPSCINGTCSAPNVCNCTGSGFSGTRCEIPVCALACQNGGICTAPDICECSAGFSGEQCQLLSGFSRIAAGIFTMGSPENEVGRDPPDDVDLVETQHTVTLTRPFWMKTTEVTQGEWFALMGTSPSGFASCGSTCPVETVSWLDAVAYANALSDAQGLTRCYTLGGCSGTPGVDFVCTQRSFVGLSCPGYRLPIEAEWEYAARAGTSTATYAGNITETGSGADPVLTPIAWYVASSADRTRPAAGRGANEWGLYDMLGNVAEWVHDGLETYGFAPETDPIGSWDEGFLVRGGAWNQQARRCRAAWRGLVSNGLTQVDYIGFRVVRTAH